MMILNFLTKMKYRVIQVSENWIENYMAEEIYA